MAPSLDRVLAGLGSGLQTFAGLQGQANRYKDEQAQQEQERQRQISRDALAKALGDAQIKHLGEPSDFERFKSDPEGYSQFKAAGFRPLAPGKQYDLRQDADGNYVYIPRPEAGSGKTPMNTGITAPPPPAMVMPTADGIVSVTRPRHGSPTATPVPGAGGGQLQPVVPEAANTAVQENNRLIQQVDAALALLKKHPDATGLSKKAVRAIPMAGPALTAKMGTPGDDSTRVAVGRINAGAVHEMFGGNLTRTEVGRSDFAPDVGFDAEANVRRLEGIRDKAMSGNQSILQQHPGAKGVMGGAKHGGSPADRWEELVAGGMDKAAATAQVKQEFNQ